MAAGVVVDAPDVPRRFDDFHVPTVYEEGPRPEFVLQKLVVRLWLRQCWGGSVGRPTRTEKVRGNL